MVFVWIYVQTKNILGFGSHPKWENVLFQDYSCDSSDRQHRDEQFPVHSCGGGGAGGGIRVVSYLQLVPPHWEGEEEDQWRHKLTCRVSHKLTVFKTWFDKPDFFFSAHLSFFYCILFVATSTRRVLTLITGRSRTISAETIMHYSEKIREGPRVWSGQIQGC